jgi:hypothetical protein
MRLVELTEKNENERKFVQEKNICLLIITEPRINVEHVKEYTL